MKALPPHLTAARAPSDATTEVRTMSKTVSRKDDHIRIGLEESTRCSVNHFDDVYLVHEALPEVDKDSIALGTRLFGRKLEAPIIISAITGGSRLGGKINTNLARAAADTGLGMGVGSQRAAVEKAGAEKTYAPLADYDVPLRIANLGIPQFLPQKGGKGTYGVAEARAAMKMIDGHLLAIHMNYLQEVVQPEGDVNARGALAALAKVAAKVPVLAKETGAGVSRTVAARLKKTGVKGIDVGGCGGTSFAAVEVYRAKAEKDHLRRRLGETFWDWGIPTPVSIMEASSTGLPVVGTGGVRNGLDAAKALSLGASAAGIAYAALEPASRSYKAAREYLEATVEELRAAVFLTGGKKPADLRKAGVRLGSALGHWIE